MKRVLTYGFFLVLGVSALQDACAQGRNYEDRRLQDFTVEERVPSDFLPQGANFRGFELIPRLNTAIIYDDNVFVTDGNEVSDSYTRIQPSLGIYKPFGPHSFNLKVEGDIKRYANEVNENSEGYKISTAGFYEPNKTISAFYEIGTGRSALSRSDPSEAQSSRVPVNVNTHNAALGVGYGFNRLKLSLIGRLARQTFEDGESRVDGSRIVGKDRNRNDREAILRATYDILGQDGNAPEHVLFAQTNYLQQRFDRVPGGSGIITASQRDNDEIGFLLGLNTRYKGLIKGRAALGYFLRDFDDNEDVDRFDIDLDLAMNITPKFTLFLEAGRDFNQDNTFSNGVVRTTSEVGADYEVLHNLYFGGRIEYISSEFTGDRDGREDDETLFGLNARYLHSPYFQSRLKFETISRDSNEEDEDFDRNIIMYTLTSQY